MSDKPKQFRFHCTQCGSCCTGSSEHYIEVSQEEQDNIRNFLNLSHQWFKRRYIVRYNNTINSIKIEQNGKCTFLGDNKRCRIYTVRPKQCRSYPFWPEIVVNAGAWHAESKRCEGIGNGDIVPLRKIEKILKNVS